MKLLAGFDVGGTNARLCLYDASFTIVGQARTRVREATAPEEIAATLLGLLDKVLASDELDAAVIDAAVIDAVGIGLAGQLSVDGELVVNAPNLGWRDVALAQMLREHLAPAHGTARVKVVNDLSALLWGEHAAGAVAGASDVLAVYVGTGVGGAILAGGRLIDGAGGKAGEIGHFKVAVGGRLCGCGQRGCLEAYVGGIHLESQVAELAHAHDIAQVFMGDEREIVDLSRADALSHSVAELDALWERASDYLALSLANACTLLNPAVLLLGGGVLANCFDLRERVLTKTLPLVLAAARSDMDIRLPTLGEEAGMLGAALLASI
ncbi:MAG: ROK family protein [Bradymonadaceae bacterium]|nr:ROK family protein [Lujinxingiaceae bacterium]